jgi:hypothetical protein
MTVNWNPNADRDIKRMVVRNLTPKYRAALANVTCPDHGEHPTIEAHDEEWRIRRCCEKAETLAYDTIRKVNASLGRLGKPVCQLAGRGHHGAVCDLRHHSVRQARRVDYRYGGGRRGRSGARAGWSQGQAVRPAALPGDAPPAVRGCRGPGSRRRDPGERESRASASSWRI